jgi:ParB-like chromosome segregation protein Spo0J
MTTTPAAPRATAARPYQLLPPLSPEEYATLKASIAQHGVRIPVEKDADGNTLDGHHREAIARELGIDCPTVTRHFDSEQEKREFVLAVNYARRHLDPLQRGRVLKQWLEERGIERGRGKVNQHTRASATVAEAVKAIGVPERTARRYLADADAYEALPKPLRVQVDARELTLPQAKRAAEREAKAARNRRAARGTPTARPPTGRSSTATVSGNSPG